MNKKQCFIIPFLIFILIFSLCFFVSCKPAEETPNEEMDTEESQEEVIEKEDAEIIEESNEEIDTEESQEEAIEKEDAEIIEESKEQVPLPSAEYITGLFFELINDRRITEAIDMMTNEMAGDDASKQAWGVHFNAIKSINVQSIEPYNEEQWTDAKKVFEVTLEAYVSSEAKDAPIPYYGWHDNPNIRWVSVEKDASGFWKIAALATGP